MNPKPLKLGFDNYSIRALGWKAPQLIEYAASFHLDTLLLSDLDVFERDDPAYLADLKSQADDRGIELQVGTLSICPSSVLWTDRYGPPEELLRRTIRVAKAVGSRVARCVLGKVDDRRSPGGIEARIEETIQILRRVRSDALDAGVKIAVENHAGDMQARELVSLIEGAGTEFVGATMDSGNATWALEHPLQNLEILGPYALSTGIRDSALWHTPEGAMLQWMAMGEGAVDFSAYFRRFAELCPDTPVQLEIISGRHTPLPFLRDEFWEAYPNVRPRDFARFIGLLNNGAPREPFRVPPGQDPTRAEQQFQKAELERSLRYCQDVLKLGTKRRGA